MSIDIKTIGACVGSEIHGLLTWCGDSISYWGLFDKEPIDIKLNDLRSHLINAISDKEVRPEGYIMVHSFIIN